MKTDKYRHTPVVKAARTLCRVLRSALVPAVCLLALSGCADSGSESIEEQEANDAWMTFNIHNLTETTARDIADEPHTDEAATATENYINCENKDLSVMFLNKDGKVMKVFNNDEFVIMNTGTADELNRNYKLMLHINKEYLPAGDDGNVTFSLLVIANLNGTGSGSSYDLNWMASVSELSALQKSFGYTGTYASDGTNRPWTPDITAKRLIPMAGIRQFSVSRDNLLAANAKENELDLSQSGGNIEMQRAMAKIRVLDGLAANGYTDNEIVSVTLTGMNTQGAYLPSIEYNPAWGNPNTAVCHRAIAAAGWYDTTSEIPSYTLTGSGMNGWGFYIPEFSWITAPAGADPALNFTVRLKSANELKTYRYPLAKILKGNGTDLTRNHIFEFVVTEVANTEVALTLNVEDWGDAETVWDYTENPGLAAGGAIKFDETTCGIDYGKAEVVFRNDKADIKANFTLAQPVNATWHAVFIHESGTQGAFLFVDSNGNEVESVSGNIDGSQANLTIRTKDTPVTENNRARLQIIVSTADGRSVTADVLKDGGYNADKTYITLIQNHQLQ